MSNSLEEIQQKGLYHPSFEHDNCGIGAIINIEGKASHKIVDDALSIVENLEHRAGKDAEGKTGDGVGILTQIPHKFFQKDERIRRKSAGKETIRRGYVLFPTKRYGYASGAVHV